MGLEGGISVIAWGVNGYRLLVAESGSVAQVGGPHGLPPSHFVPANLNHSQASIPGDQSVVVPPHQMKLITPISALAKASRGSQQDF